MSSRDAGKADWSSIKESLYDGEDMTPDEEGYKYRRLVREFFETHAFAEADYDAYQIGVEQGEASDKEEADRNLWTALFG